MTEGRKKPQNIGLERAVLGALLIDGKIPPAIRELLTPEDFYSPGHSDVYRAALKLDAAGTRITILTVEENLKSISRAVTADFIVNISECGLPDSIDIHAKVVADIAKRCRVIDLLEAAQSRFYDDRIDGTGVSGALLELARDLAPFATNGAGAGHAPGSAVTIRISDVQRETVTWLWKDRIPIGKLTMLEGNPGLGKSWLTLAIATAVSTGAALPGDSPRPPANVVLMSAEDGLGDTIRPRLEDMGADLSRIIALQGIINKKGHEDVVTLADLDVLEQVIISERPALVIIDPIIAYVAGKDTSKANEVRGILSPLAALAEKHGVALLAVRHLNKGNAQALYRGQGSIDFIAAARAAFVVGENPDDSTERVLCHLKSNLAPKTPSLAFSIEAGVLRWRGDSELTAEQVLAAPAAGDERNATDELMEWLKDQLEDGPRPTKEIQREARAAGYQDKPLRSARERLGIKPKKGGFSGPWMWSLPQNTQLNRQESQVASSPPQGILGILGTLDDKGHLRENEEVI